MCKVTVVKVLKKLADTNSKIVYIDDYKRTTIQIIDTYNMFRTKEEQTVSPFKLVGNDKYANFSVRHIINGKVLIHPMDAKAVDLPNEIKAVKYINQTIIKDGKLNVNEIVVIVNATVANVLRKVKGLVVNEATRGNETKMRLNLAVIPVADTKLTDNDILNMVKKVNYLTIDKKIIESLLPTEKPNAMYNDKQKEVLTKYGLTNGVYMGINNVQKEASEAYKITEVKFTLKGYSSIPSVNSIFADDKAPTKGIKKTMYDRYYELKKMDTATLNEMLKIINKELNELKIRLTNARVVKVNSNASNTIVDNGIDKLKIELNEVEKSA